MVENLSRWLRSVRPRTAADDDWTATPEAAAVLAAIHRRTAAAGETPTQPRMTARRLWLPAGALAAAGVVALVVVSSNGTTGSPPGVHAGPAHLPAIRPAAMLLSGYSSCSEALSGLRSHTASTVGPYGFPGQQRDYAALAAAAPNAGAAPAPTAPTARADTSTTNVQEAGVDEPDVVKTDGTRLVTITDGVLRVVDGTDRKVTGSLDLTMYVGWQNAQLLVDGDHALVILGGGYGGGVAYSVPASPAPMTPVVASAMNSTYLFVDLAGSVTITGSLRATGSYLSARQVGSTVRLVVSSKPTINFPAHSGSDAQSTARNQGVIRATPLSAWLPRYSLTNGSASTDYRVPCGQISHPKAYTGTSMLTIYTLDLTHLGAPAQPVSVAADGDTVYATSTSLYIASNPQWACCSTAPTSTTQQTEMHRFNITGSAPPTYLGSGSVPGRLLSQYSLSDHAGSLRLATTSGIGGGGGGAPSSSVYVLNADTLKTSGHVDGLGQGEQIYAVRFLGTVAYVVTFRQTDPLYVIDLRDPSAPKLAGTLQLTGYSDYLHDAGHGRLIGVGQEASQAGRIAGLQVSLFDVNNPAAPTRTGHVVLSDAPGETTLDPHAFLYWQPTGLIVVPIQSWASDQSGRVLVLKVSGPSLRSVGLLANPLAGSTDDGRGIQRSVIVDGALWTLSSSGIQISDPASLSRRAWIPFG